MIPYTDSARQAIERHLDALRAHARLIGADPEEVAADIRQHLESELSDSNLGVVTEQDVGRAIARIGPDLTDSKPESSEERIAPGEERNATNQSIRREWFTTANYFFWGVLLPVVALVTELITGACAEEFIDPLPSWLHVLLVALVPIANELARRVATGQRGLTRWIWHLNGASVGICLFYSLMFLPGTPFAALGIVFFGLGFLPLAPLIALITGLLLRKRLRQRLQGGLIPTGKTWPLGFALGFGFLLVGSIPSLLTHYGGQLAASGAEPQSANAVKWLRALGDRELMLRNCYGTRRGPIEEFLFRPPPQEAARALYYRVTGIPFNAVTPPRNIHSRRNRFVNDLYEFGGAEWDSGLGGDVVAGRVRGLSLSESRIDGICSSDHAWSYLEWTLEFRNDHETAQREARAQIQLPPGGVVSRLTLWVEGEEREAAFAGRAQVRSAYTKVAVQQRRDPVLVNTSGPDRILVQCFPIPPQGKTMKIRLGITAPLMLRKSDEATLVWPTFAERNFGLPKTLNHHIWVEGPTEFRCATPKLISELRPPNRPGIHGELTDFEIASPHNAVRITRNPLETEYTAVQGSGHTVRQWIERSVAIEPTRLAVVLDGSEGMTAALEEFRSALDQYHGKAQLAVFLAQDGIQDLSAGDYSTKAAANLRGRFGVGGQDNVPALVKALDWAGSSTGGTVLWIHGPQPVLMSSLGGLEQRLQWRGGDSGLVIHDFASKIGANRVTERLEGSAGWLSVPRLGGVREDIDYFFDQWRTGAIALRVLREPTVQPPGKAPSARGSHVVRLWARDEIHRLDNRGQRDAAIRLAGEMQLVTRVSGAVVLETRQQFEQAGLTSVEPQTVPIIPEPGTWALLMTGAGLWILINRLRLTAERHKPTSYQ